MVAKDKNDKTKAVFQNAVKCTPEISDAYANGLQALKRGETMSVNPTNTYDVDGSVDIDEAVKKIYPNEARWDYAIGYNGKVYFIEIHPAYTSEVGIMKKKLVWLKNWLKNKAPLLNSIPKSSPAYIWIQSGKCAILPNSKQAKELAYIGLKPVPRIKLV